MFVGKQRQIGSAFNLKRNVDIKENISGVCVSESKLWRHLACCAAPDTLIFRPGLDLILNRQLIVTII